MRSLGFTITAAALAVHLAGCGGRQQLSAADRRSEAPTSRADRSSGGAMWGANYFPNVPLTSQNGEKAGFFDWIKGKVVAVNFIYTKCSDSCPMETARMVEVQKLLGDRMGKDVFFYSISIDPGHDTPQRLKEYSELFHAGPGWTFLTGRDEDVTLLRKKLGVYEPDLKKKDHNLGLLIGNQKTGRWMKRSPFENPYMLAVQLGSWLHNWRLPNTANRDFADAPEVRNISAGEEMFRARCASCHTVGKDDTSNADARRTGPDLFGVLKRRDRKWLERWIIAPDAMLAEKDPIATQLLAAYKDVPMPNQRLSQGDVELLLEYLAEASGNAPARMLEASAAAAPGRTRTGLAVPPRAGGGSPAELAVRAGAAGTSPAGVAAPAGAAQASAAALPLAELTPPLLAAIRESLAAYEKTRQGLAADDLASAQTHAALVLTSSVRAAKAAPQGAPQRVLQEIAASANGIQKAADLSEARRMFGELSQRVVGLLVREPALRAGRSLFMCPMAPGYKKWVQTSSKLENPYMGKRMPHCGMPVPEWSDAAS